MPIILHQWKYKAIMWFFTNIQHQYDLIKPSAHFMLSKSSLNILSQVVGWSVTDNKANLSPTELCCCRNWAELGNFNPSHVYSVVTKRLLDILAIGLISSFDKP